MIEDSKMKRRDFTMKIVIALISAKLAGCSYLGFTVGNSNVQQKETSQKGTPGKKSTSNVSRRRSRSSSITDLKTLSKLLQQARHPLSEMQIEYLLTLKPGPEFSEKMMDILDDSQKEALKNASGGRKGGRRRR